MPFAGGYNAEMAIILILIGLAALAALAGIVVIARRGSSVLAGIGIVICVLVLLFVGFMIVAFSSLDGFGPGVSDFDYALAGGYRLYRTSTDQISIESPIRDQPDDKIRAKVIEIGWGSRFILAMRQPLDSKGDPIPRTFDYWILDTNGPTRFGPFSEQEFVGKRVELGVPKELVLKDVYSYQ